MCLRFFYRFLEVVIKKLQLGTLKYFLKKKEVLIPFPQTGQSFDTEII